MLKEPFLVVSFCDHIDQDVVLFPEAIDLVLLNLGGSSASMECYALIDILLLCYVIFVSICECHSEIVQHCFVSLCSLLWIV